MCEPFQDENFDPEEENKYMPSNWSHRYDAATVEQKHEEFTTYWSAKVNKSLPYRKNVKYGDTERCVMDFYDKDLPRDAPIFVFIHGGYWVFGNKELYSYVAETFWKSGIVTVNIEYDLAPSVKIMEIVEEIKQAMSCLVQYAQDRESRGIYLSGHSAGAHLAAMVMSSDWMNNPMNKKFLKGVILISGVLDVSPLVKTSLAKIIRDVLQEASPLKIIDKGSNYIDADLQVIVAVGEYDPPKFIEQSKKYYEKLLTKNIASKYLLIPNEDHYSIIENLYNEDNILTKEILKLCQQ